MGFGTEKRAIGGLVKSTTEIPGPGQYTIDHASINGTQIGFGTSKRDKGGIVSNQNYYVPGPGQYNKEDEIGKGGPQVSMKFRPQSATMNKHQLDIPGPGSYNPNVGVVKHQTPGAKMGTGKRDGGF